MAELSHVVEELLERAAATLWTGAEFTAPVLVEACRAEAYGLWWGAFVLALEMDALETGAPGRIPDTWSFSTWVRWVREAAQEAQSQRTGAPVGEVRP